MYLHTSASFYKDTLPQPHIVGDDMGLRKCGKCEKRGKKHVKKRFFSESISFHVDASGHDKGLRLCEWGLFQSYIYIYGPLSTPTGVVVYACVSVHIHRFLYKVL